MSNKQTVIEILHLLNKQRREYVLNGPEYYKHSLGVVQAMLIIKKEFDINDEILNEVNK